MVRHFSSLFFAGFFLGVLALDIWNLLNLPKLLFTLLDLDMLLLMFILFIKEMRWLKK